MKLRQAIPLTSYPTKEPLKPRKPKERLENQLVQIDGYVCERYRIIGTRTIIHTAYEPAAGHSTLQRFEEINPSDHKRALGRRNLVWWGKVGTEPLPRELEALPRGDERYHRVRAWQDEQNERAYSILKEAFPYLIGDDELSESGEITIVEGVYPFPLPQHPRI